MTKTKDKVISFKNYVKHFIIFIQNYYFCIEIGKLRGIIEPSRVKPLIHLSRKELAKTIIATRHTNTTHESDVTKVRRDNREYKAVLEDIVQYTESAYIKDKINNVLHMQDERDNVTAREELNDNEG